MTHGAARLLLFLKQYIILSFLFFFRFVSLSHKHTDESHAQAQLHAHAHDKRFLAVGEAPENLLKWAKKSISAQSSNSAVCFSFRLVLLTAAASSCLRGCYGGRYLFFLSFLLAVYFRLLRTRRRRRLRWLEWDARPTTSLALSH